MPNPSRIRLGIHPRLQLGRKFGEDVPRLAAGQTLGQRLQHRLGRALRDVGRQVGGLPPDGLDDLLVLHSRSLRPAPARPYPPSR